MRALFWFSSTATLFSRHLMYSFFFLRHSLAASLFFCSLISRFLKLHAVITRCRPLSSWHVSHLVPSSGGLPIPEEPSADMAGIKPRPWPCTQSYYDLMSHVLRCHLVVPHGLGVVQGVQSPVTGVGRGHAHCPASTGVQRLHPCHAPAPVTQQGAWTQFNYVRLNMFSK